MTNNYKIPLYKGFDPEKEFIYSYRKIDNPFESILSGEYWNSPVIENIEIFNYIRGTYLNKEQIEKEGWVSLNLYKTVESFQKEDVILIKLLGYLNNEIISCKISLYSPYRGLLYNGDCLSINEFKFICKLLNINNEKTT